jgi:hypothetical protein
MLVVNAKRRPVLVLVTALLGGCADTIPIVDYYDVDTDSLQRYASMAIATQSAIDRGKFHPVEEVMGLYCRKDVLSYDVMSPEAKKIAIDQVKLRAAMEKADAVSEPQCTPDIRGNFGNNCISTLTCVATVMIASTD